MKPETAAALIENVKRNCAKANAHLFPQTGSLTGTGTAIAAAAGNLGPAAVRKRARLYDNNPDRPLSYPVAQHHQTPALDPAVPREAQGAGRARVRFTGYRVRPLDPDNFAGSVKDLLDGLRHAGIISGDEPWRIILETEQVRIKNFRNEHTAIEITRLP